MLKKTLVVLVASVVIGTSIVWLRPPARSIAERHTEVSLEATDSEFREAAPSRVDRDRDQELEAARTSVSASAEADPRGHSRLGRRILRGRVVDVVGRSAIATVSLDGTERTFHQEIDVARSGYFEIDVARDVGQIAVRAITSNTESQTVHVDASAPEIEPDSVLLVLSPRAGNSIAGLLRDEYGAPLNPVLLHETFVVPAMERELEARPRIGFIVDSDDVEIAGLEFVAVVNPRDSSFQCRGLPTSVGTLRATNLGRIDASVAVDAANANDVIVVLPRDFFASARPRSVFVVDAERGAPIAEALVELIALPDVHRDRATVVFRTRTGERGDAMVEFPPEGVYSLCVRAPTHATAHRRMELDPTVADDAPLVVALGSERPLTVVAESLDGGPVSAEVERGLRAFTPDGIELELAVRTRSVAASSRTLEVRGLGPGEVRIALEGRVVAVDPATTSSCTVSVGGAEARIVIECADRFVNTANAVAPAIYLRILAEPGAMNVGSDGRYTLSRSANGYWRTSVLLNPGRYRIEADGGVGAPERVTVDAVLDRVSSIGFGRP